ncbi:MAG TPA: protease modulator HflC [Bdellovibrionales bacterium]|nr:MAG: HflC protein [Bdellovibrionales bacterium GWB1_52_6]OFZ05864.1 MAG: HflC protein [Bdellovibrionales bacterium GWA1_52_35]OFZ37054.1 MAG: HflC protein [Bdellovibrionales bacterium GWC1_52_8]HAR41354.1 protease modulator HflC [Bdellovibrionales bacterium]HCM39754.1 protease modulator HflC [Bdellovibrionales bacterium]
MNPNRIAAIVILTVLGIAATLSAAYVVPEGRQAVITQFGRPIGTPVTSAGIHVKMPFIQDVQYVDKRIMTWDGFPNQIPTRDKKYILVDTTARWRIHDALKFIQTVQNERGAKARIDAILDAIVRDTISNHNLVEAVRNSNKILEYIEVKAEEARKRVASGTLLVAEEEEITGEIEKIQTGRENLSGMIAKKAEDELRDFGITVIDVQIRRIAYESSVEKKVYERMISERKRIAEKIRSIGMGEQAKIQGKTSRDLQRIDSEAYRKAQQTKGKAEAESIGIYARSLSQDRKFFEFVRTMDAYKKALKDDTQLILSADSGFLQMLKKQP